MIASLKNIIRTKPTHRKICIAEFVDESHRFWLILAVENVKLEMPLLTEIKKIRLINQRFQQQRQQTTALQGTFYEFGCIKLGSPSILHFSGYFSGLILKGFFP